MKYQCIMTQWLLSLWCGRKTENRPWVYCKNLYSNTTYVNYNLLIPDRNPFLNSLDFIFSGAHWRHAAAPWPILKITIFNKFPGGTRVWKGRGGSSFFYPWKILLHSSATLQDSLTVKNSSVSFWTPCKRPKSVTYIPTFSHKHIFVVLFGHSSFGFYFVTFSMSFYFRKVSFLRFHLIQWGN